MAKSTSCPFYAQGAIQSVSELALYNTESIMDIEDLVESAKEEKGCPYYAARNAAKDAQVRLIPFVPSIEIVILTIVSSTGHNAPISNAIA